MGRHKKYKGVCKYCGMGLKQGGHICGDCSMKLKLIRTMQKMIRDTVERVGGI
jgi:predicted amidophosphoribosyltransferase